MDKSDVLKRLNHKGFQPLPLLENAMAQTLAGTAWPYVPLLTPSPRHIVGLADGDALSVHESRPQAWRSGDRIVVLVHGLIDHYRVAYMIRSARKLSDAGFLVYRVNLRGCGTGFGLAEKIYNAGQSEDIREVLRWISKMHPTSPITQVGFSLGANITLKMAGEDGASPTANLDSVVAVSSPLDLRVTSAKLKNRSGFVVNKFFVLKLLRHVRRHHVRYPHLEKPELSPAMKIHEFDELYTAPKSGYKTADEYHEKSSCGPFVPNIRVRNLVLCAKDDPVVDAESYTSLKFPTSTELVMTEHGGHVGFLGEGSPDKDLQWMDSLVQAWIADLRFAKGIP